MTALVSRLVRSHDFRMLVAGSSRRVRCVVLIVLIVVLFFRRVLFVIPCALAVVEQSDAPACSRCESVCCCMWASSSGSLHLTVKEKVVWSCCHTHCRYRFRVLAS